VIPRPGRVQERVLVDRPAESRDDDRERRDAELCPERLEVPGVQGPEGRHLRDLRLSRQGRGDLGPDLVGGQGLDLEIVTHRAGGRAALDRSGRTAHIVLANAAFRSGAADGREVDAEVLGELPDGRGRPDQAAGRTTLHRRIPRSDLRRLRRSFGNARGARRPFDLEGHKRPTHRDVLALGAVQGHDAPRVRRGDLDHRFRGLDLDERLVQRDVVSLGDEPADDLAVLQPFAEVRHREDPLCHQ
jgi:hypothetical protein